MNLDHRGAFGCEPNTGDGAGILIQMPHEFLVKATAKLGFKLPAVGEYGAGMLFLPPNPLERKAVKTAFAKIVSAEGQTLLGWRDVPTDNSSLGKTAVAAEPLMAQVFIGRNPELKDEAAFERKLYVIRKLAEQKIRYGSKIDGGKWFYVSSLSVRTMIYKGMLMPEQVAKYYPDLRDESMVTAMALVHSRFSTNTFPSWDRAHPNRYIAHNGEINTLRGNVNWMKAAQANFKSALFGKDIKKVIPVINEDGSDSAQFDNCLELLVMAGRELPHAMMMMIPEPWENHESMDAERRAFYEYQFLPDRAVGRPGLDGVHGRHPHRRVPGPQRPAPVALLRHEGRRGHHGVGSRRAAGRAGARREQGPVAAGPDVSGGHRAGPHHRGRGAQEEIRLARIRIANGWTNITCCSKICRSRRSTPSRRTGRFCSSSRRSATRLKICVSSSARWRSDGVQPLGSMGTDTPLAVLSNKPQLLYNYFKQLFAQVTNPPIDPIREEIITSTHTMVGSRGGLLNPRPGKLRAHPAGAADSHQRGTGKTPAHQPARFPSRDAADFVQGRGRRKRSGSGAGRIVCRPPTRPSRTARTF